MQTNVHDCFNAWMADPDKPADPTLLDAFVEGFAQAMEFISGEPRVRPSQEPPDPDS